VADILTLGFGTSVLMWWVCYLCRIPPALVPNWLLLTLLLLCLATGGYVAGRTTGQGWKSGLRVGILSSVLNLLILGSLLGGAHANSVAPAALWWIPGSILTGAALCALGAILAGRVPRPSVPASIWTARFSIVAASATMLLLIAGGVVTSTGTGLAVVDWPNSFGYGMFLYPLSKMTGGIYYEHAHRLFGSLVGLTTLVLAIHIQQVESRRWVRNFALGALALVIVQGVLGGLRVTGHLTTSTSPLETRPSILLAIVHGVTGQLFLAGLTALSAFTSPTWTSDRPATRTSGASTDRGLALLLLGLLMVQLVLGAILRHVSRGLLIHITLAVLVAVVSVAAGARASWFVRGQPILQRLGRALLISLGVQIVLGFGALMVRSQTGTAETPSLLRVIVTTLHQTNGAILLATTALLGAWSRRLLDVPGRNLAPVDS
jgi:heme A synthase